MNQEVYIVLCHVENAFQNEFVGIFTTIEKASSFCKNLIETSGTKVAYSGITIHPISLDEAFDFSFTEKTLISFVKNPTTNLLELKE